MGGWGVGGHSVEVMSGSSPMQRSNSAENKSAALKEESGAAEVTLPVVGCPDALVATMASLVVELATLVPALLVVVALAFLGVPAETTATDCEGKGLGQGLVVQEPTGFLVTLLGDGGLAAERLQVGVGMLIRGTGADTKGAAIEVEASVTLAPGTPGMAGLVVTPVT